MTSPVIRTSGSSFIGPDGQPLILRGVCLGGWLNMENFITGYARPTELEAIAASPVNLRSTLDKRAFPELWSMRTGL